MCIILTWHTTSNVWKTHRRKIQVSFILRKAQYLSEKVSHFFLFFSTGKLRTQVRGNEARKWYTYYFASTKCVTYVRISLNNEVKYLPYMYISFLIFNGRRSHELSNFWLSPTYIHNFHQNENIFKVVQGQCHEVFDRRNFSIISFRSAPLRNCHHFIFFKNSLRY